MSNVYNGIYYDLLLIYKITDSCVALLKGTAIAGHNFNNRTKSEITKLQNMGLN